MSHNVLNSALLTIALALPIFSNALAQPINEPWNPSPVGVCSKNFERELMEQRKSNGELVVSRVKTKIKSSKKRYVWVWDGTPSRNQTKMLYEIQGRRGCIILFMPYADTTDFKIGDDGSLPSTVTSETQPLPNPFGGYSSTLITYSFDKKLGRYGKLPSSCERKTEAGVMKINCTEAFE